MSILLRPREPARVLVRSRVATPIVMRAAAAASMLTPCDESFGHVSAAVENPRRLPRSHHAACSIRVQVHRSSAGWVGSMCPHSSWVGDASLALAAWAHWATGAARPQETRPSPHHPRQRGVNCLARRQYVRRQGALLGVEGFAARARSCDVILDFRSALAGTTDPPD